MKVFQSFDQQNIAFQKQEQYTLAYQLLAKIERESEPDQIERRREADLYRNSYSCKLNDVKR